MHATAKNCLVKITTVQVTAVSGFIEQVGSMINHFNPIAHVWLHHTAHCAEKKVYAHYLHGAILHQQKGWNRGRWVRSPPG